MIAPIPSKFSFTTDTGESQDIHIGKPSENENFEDGQSATQKPTTHTFPLDGKRINIIDTPGIGDSRGVEQDKKNFDSILGHISHIKEIHGICILLKPNNARLTVVFRFCIQQLLAHLHKDAARNIVFCFTHARGNFYRPGDTLPALRKELIDRNVDIELDRSNMYCFDSEAFRFLACIKAGVIFPDEDVEVFSSSWTRAVKETTRMIDHIKTLRPHGVCNTLSMNDARSKVVAMSRPMAEMSVAIQKNIREAKEAQVKAQLADSEAVDFEKQLHVDGVDLEYKQLGYPRTVCTHSDCIEYIAAGRDNVKQVNYKQQCHRHCNLTGVPTETVGDSRLQRCEAMSQSDYNCFYCSHSYKLHMHRTYDLVTVKRSFISVEVQEKIKEKKDAKSRMEAAVNELINLVNEFEAEQKVVLRVCVNYGSFLRDAAMIPYNDALGDYLDMTIQQEEEKQPALRDQDLINRLQKSKRAYEEEKAVIENALQESGNRSIGLRFTPEQIEKLQEELFKMKHFGQSLRNIFWNIDRLNRVTYEQRKVVYNTVGWRSRAFELVVNPIKDLVVRGVNLVRGSQTAEDKKEKTGKRFAELTAEELHLADNKAHGKVSADEDEDEDDFASLEENDSSADVDGEGGLVDNGSDKQAATEESDEGIPVVTRVISIRPKLKGKV